VTNPNSSRAIDAFPVSSLALDPRVLLVPVQVFVLFSDEHPKSTDPPAQLALWDRVPGQTTAHDTVPPGDLTISQHAITNWICPPATRPPRGGGCSCEGCSRSPR
jgi:hypothetical protein